MSDYRVVARYDVMLCPPTGRGLFGTIEIATDGEALFTSEEVDVRGYPALMIRVHVELVEPKVRFGGRINLSNGQYLVFGKKPIARGFLNDLQQILHAA